MFFGGRNKPCALQKKRMNFTGRAHGHKTWTIQASVVGEDVVLLLVVDLGVVVVRVGRLLLLVGRIEVDDLKEKKTNGIGGQTTNSKHCVSDVACSPR